MSKWDFECQTTILGPISNVKKRKAKKEKRILKTEKQICVPKRENKKRKTNIRKNENRKTNQLQLAQDF